MLHVHHNVSASGNRSVAMHDIHVAIVDLTDDAMYKVAANYLNVSCGRAKVNDSQTKLKCPRQNALQLSYSSV